MNGAQWRGLAKLASEAIVHGSHAIERVQIATAARTFDLLERIPAVAPAAGLVRVCHDGITSFTHTNIRAVAGLVEATYSAFGSNVTLSNQSVTAEAASAPISSRSSASVP
jgi:hypothetical protein